MAGWLPALGTGTQPYSLLVSAVDVIDYVPAETLRVTASGSPGFAGTMTFMVEDFGSVLTIRDGAEVQFWDNSANRLHFGGVITNRVVRKGVSGQGRVTSVTATSFDAWLDWRQIIHFQTDWDGGGFK